jgi:membrane fusion protein (multidrug efflux system)
MKSSQILAVILALYSFALPACNVQKEEHHEQVHKITATMPLKEDVTLKERFVCQIHSRRHIEVRALERGYLEAVPVQEGQAVKEGEVMFQVIPILYQSKFDAQQAEAKSAELEFKFGKNLNDKKVISENQVALLNAKKLKAEADAKLAEAELNFASVKAPFDGIIDRLHSQQGSLVEKGDILTTLSDNSLMWVYFNVPEVRYLDFMANFGQHPKDLKVDLLLADGKKFNEIGHIAAIEADFNNQTGNIPFRADFPNPDGLLRNGQTGTVSISRVQNDAIIIPQRATFEVLNKRCVYVIDQDNVAHQREIAVQNELEDVFVIKQGLSVDDKIIYEGVRQVHDGDQVEYVERPPDEVFKKLKYHAE